MEVESVIRKYTPEVYADFPAKAFLGRFKDPKIDQTHQPILKTFHSFYKNHVGSSTSKSRSLLEVGGGPCIYTLITAAKYVDTITFSDVSENNLREVKLWKEENPEAHDWSKYVEYVVQELEGDHSEDAVRRRKKLLRGKIKNIIACDVRRDSFFDGEYESCQYDIVQSSGCFEVAMDTREAYHEGIVKLASYVKPGGYLQLRTATEGTRYSCSGRNMYLLNVLAEDNLKGIELAESYADSPTSKKCFIEFVRPGQDGSKERDVEEQRQREKKRKKR